MLKQVTIAAFAVTAVSAFAQESSMTIDAKAAKPGELAMFLKKDAYKKLSAPDAYVLTKFLGDLPGNYATALSRSLASIAEMSYNKKMENQTAANAMAPMGDEMAQMEPLPHVDYMTTVDTLEKIHGQTDRGLVDQLFHPVEFTRSLIPTYTNERVLDAIGRYIKANAMWEQPVRLKYTSLAPHTYVSPVIPR